VTVSETEPDSFVATGHPLRHLLVVLGLLASACVALWWTGLAAPRLSVGLREGRFDTATGRGTLALALHNGSPLAFEVRGLAADYEGIQLSRVRVDGHDVRAGPADVPGGKTAQVEADLVVDCDRLRAASFDPIFWQTEETFQFTLGMPVGAERGETRRVVGALNPLLSRACSPGG